MSASQKSLQKVVKRAIGHLSRRLERPELLAAFDRTAAQALREEIAMHAVISAALAENSTYADIGTNRGQVLRWALRAAPSGRHIAFEPIPELAAEIRRAHPGVDCRAMAISDAPGRSSFCHFHGMDGWSGLQRRPEVDDDVGKPETIDVPVSTLDVELAGLQPKLIKIDVEGAEYAVLRGAHEVISGTRPLIVFEHEPSAAALYGYTSTALWDFLTGFGYRVFAITGEGPLTDWSDTAPNCVNWIASPRNGTPSGI